MIPRFPAFKPIELTDRDAVEAFLAAHPPLASEYTFTNLFAWRETYRYQLAAFGDGFLILKTDHAGRPALLQPLVAAEKRAAVLAALEYLRGLGAAPVIERAGEDFLAGEDWASWPVTVTEDRDNADYVYSVPELIALKGEKYHDKKNLLHQFEKRYPGAHYVPLAPELIGRSLLFQHEWCEERECAHNDGLQQEMCAVFQMLTHFESLSAVGGAIELDGRLIALTLGERLNAETFVIHIEKAKPGVAGLYQAINREFLAHAVLDYPYVNREQDLGIPGLRKAKLSYNPVRMVMKYRIGEG
ncbi:MAG TPA: phosphatidylglycerol lysyltransferase domain-containing protein [Armatimonadota bacterium]|nr:phosphatidylglycerol lysyltransferase domain-containing protein [Armatimonadota bacterium]HOS44797.1 phosphatidylglycerol lysyltransferase domain-containing protein [Armatimonadota bacterium]